MVNVGMKSMPGISSSIKLNTPPRNPFLKPNIRQNKNAEIGAQINSPKTGTTITALPIKSIKRQVSKDGKGLDSSGKYFTSFLKNNLFILQTSCYFLAAEVMTKLSGQSLYGMFLYERFKSS